MRGAVQYLLFSGIGWFAAALLFFVAVAIPKERYPAAARMLVLLAMGVGALSGTPVPWWLAFPLVVATAAAAFALRKKVVVTVASVLVAAAVLYEAVFFFQRPARDNRQPTTVAVIGDSLSSGGFGETKPWPELLGLPALNLSMPSETVESALRIQAPRLAATGADVVLIEIGGNDMLGGTPASEFKRDLDRLLDMCRAPGRRVVMMELPILPGKWAFGAAQRRLGRKHDVELIPKRVLARVLTRSGSTTDALHLTQRGHEELAREIGHALGARARADR